MAKSKEQQKQEKADELTFDQEVFGVEGIAGKMEQDEIDAYHAKRKTKIPVGNPYTYGYRP